MKKLFRFNLTKDIGIAVVAGLVMIALSLLMIPFGGDSIRDTVILFVLRDVLMIFGLGVVFVSLYVEKKVNAQRNMIAGVEEAMIATQNYSIGDLLIVGNTLYKVTAAISSGAALVVGTNVTETTVAEQLLALA